MFRFQIIIRKPCEGSSHGIREVDRNLIATVAGLRKWFLLRFLGDEAVD